MTLGILADIEAILRSFESENEKDVKRAKAAEILQNRNNFQKVILSRNIGKWY